MEADDVKKAEVVALVLILVTVVGLFIPVTRKAEVSAARTECTNNLKHISLALHGYHDVFRIFPHAIVSGPTEAHPPERQLLAVFNRPLSSVADGSQICGRQKETVGRCGE